MKVNLTYQWSGFALFLYLVGMLESSDYISVARHLCAPVWFLSVQASILYILYNVSNKYLIKQGATLFPLKEYFRSLTKVRIMPLMNEFSQVSGKGQDVTIVVKYHHDSKCLKYHTECFSKCRILPCL